MKLAITLTALALTGALAIAAAATAAAPAGVAKGSKDVIEKIVKTDAEWKQLLTPEQFKVLREHGTERAWTSPLNNNKHKGVYVCAACGLTLFSSDTKFDSGTGWPSFWAPIDPKHVGTTVDRSFFSVRTEVHCARCGGHLGHVFPDGPPPTGQRYCMNGVSLKFEEAK
ncbi:MAG: peptide-methionine (R)-S-oxide reductase MsrB [Thermoanaerobaculia bacterium]